VKLFGTRQVLSTPAIASAFGATHGAPSQRRRSAGPPRAFPVAVTRA
jgi:hypothetical protein